ncbi:hypothetical protein L1887_18067 [Cichorium endivia]|nr:hypothetical protein L1887_18067 [Cichorium endivia]
MLLSSFDMDELNYDDLCGEGACFKGWLLTIIKGKRDSRASQKIGMMIITLLIYTKYYAFIDYAAYPHEKYSPLSWQTPKDDDKKPFGPGVARSDK